VKLVLANDEQKLARDAVTHEAWGMLLTPEAYVAREVRLRAHAWSRGALLTWLLVDDHGHVLASCETYRMLSRLRAESGSSWAVASVFTERELRGRGYASRMMSLLEESLRERDAKGHAIVLYSDVGAPIYERAGYVAPHAAFDRVWDAEPGDVSAELLDEAVEIDLPDDPFVVWPGAAQIDWHRERDRAYAALLGHAPLATAGARAGEGVVLWTRDHRKDCLLVLAWNGREPDRLFQAARRVAASAHLGKVMMWDQPGARGGSLVPREGSLPMVRALDPRVRAEDWRTIPRAIWV
jgi:GNAT superfamily N-acetyltransferase